MNGLAMVGVGVGKETVLQRLRGRCVVLGGHHFRRVGMCNV